MMRVWLCRKLNDIYFTIQNSIHIDFIREYPNSDVSGQLVLKLRDDNFTDIYNLLGENVIEGLYQKPLKGRKIKVEDRNLAIQNSAKIKTGNIAPNFTLTFIDGGEKSLTDFRGKWVVLDFWGSWCGWCIVDFPKLKKAYGKYSGKLEILGLACNDKEDDWRKAVNTHELPWVQLFNDKQGAESVSVKYGVTVYPTKVIIDPKGVIRNVTVGTQSTFYDKLNKLLK